MRRLANKSVCTLLIALAGCTSGAGVTSEPAPSSTQVRPPASADPTTAVPSASTVASTARKHTNLPIDPPMVHSPAGAFHQGSAGATGDDLGWQHTEVVPAFDLDVTEVTVEAYQACLDAGVCSYSPRSEKCNLERPRQEYKHDPVNCVTFAEAARYCEWRRAILPTDGMWEYAAGGRWGWYSPWEAKPSMRTVPSGTIGDVYLATGGTCRERVHYTETHLPSRRQYGDETTCPAGTFPRGDTPSGLKDLAGNIAEWTTTTYCRLHKKECEPNNRTVKGGSYSWGSAQIQHRYSFAETEWRPTLGFRCARVTTPTTKKGK
jgi:formylglycine-generating enzyme required for sulfatase activity